MGITKEEKATRRALSELLAKYDKDGVSGRDRLLNGELMLVERPVCKSPVLATVTLALFNGSDYHMLLMKAAVEVSRRAEYPLLGLHSAKGINLDLFEKTLDELGVRGGSDYATICAGIRKNGFILCHELTAPALRLQHLKQQKCKILNVASEPMRDVNGRWGIFRLKGGDSPELTFVDVDERWFGNSIFVCARPRQAT